MLTQSEIDQMYRDQSRLVSDTLKLSSVNPKSLKNLNRIGKVFLIERGWDKCTEDTKRLLSQDEHHFVRSCASVAISNQMLELMP